MTRIDPAARIEDGAIIGDDVTIGPFCIVGKDAVIGNGCRLISHVSITGQTSIGAGATIYPFASLGGAPQSFAYRGEPTRLEIGENCTIRESVTMGTGTVGGGGLTKVGDRCYFMACTHVGHDCRVGNDVVLANGAVLGGHCEVGDFVFIGGLSAVHQFTRIGAQAMVSGVSGVAADVIPYGFAIGQRAVLEGLNVVGMRRRKFSRERLHNVRDFYQRLFLGPGTFAERFDAVKADAGRDPASAEIAAFIEHDRKRPLCFPDVAPAQAG